MSSLDFNFYGFDGEPIGWREHAQLYRDPRRFLAREHVGPYRVSTVWLGIDHNFGDGPPLIFETMVFFELPQPAEDPLGWEQDTTRYATWDEALEGHRTIVTLIRLELGPDSAVCPTCGATVDAESAQDRVFQCPNGHVWSFAGRRLSDSDM